MSDPRDFLGYGFSRKGREAAWKDLQAGPPGRKPDCPLTLELIDFARKLLNDPSREAQIRDHLKDCRYCSDRLDAQRRAIQRMGALGRKEQDPVLADVAPLLAARRARTWAGDVTFIKNAATSGAVEERKARVELFAPPGVPGPLHGKLLWTRVRTVGAEPPSPWRLGLWFPAQSDEMPGNSPDVLDQLAGAQVEVELLDSNSEQRGWITTWLRRLENGKDLGSHPEPVDEVDNLDAITRARLVPLPKTKRYGVP